MDILRVESIFVTLRRAAVTIALVVAASSIAIDAAIPLPRVTGPLPSHAQSYPFGGAAHTRVPVDLSPRAYVEEEYLISGSANVYDRPKAGPAVVRTASAPYTTRVLVRRPRARARFSGTAIVEPLNPSMAFDLNTGWSIHHDHLMRSGDAWIGVTAKPVAIRSLKAFDPERYGRLSWANPLPATDPRNCSAVPRDSERATENGLVWDIYRHVGAWLRSAESTNPLAYGVPKTAVQRLIAWGYSQSGGFLYTYAHAIHPLDVKDQGRPLFDGYLIAAASGPAPIHQCAPPIPADDPRRQIKDVGVPVIRVMTQSDYLPNIGARLSDGNWPPHLTRNYEIAGAAQATPDELNFSAAPEDIVKAQRPVPPMACKEGPRSRFPNSVALNAILQNLKEWIANDVLPPPGQSITVGNGKPFLDKFGNLEGGVRSPYVDVPTSVWHANASGESACRTAGYEVPFEPERLRAVYRTKADYVRAVEANVADLVKQRYVTKEDGERLVEEAKKVVW
jgi:hypothetical protein